MPMTNARASFRLIHRWTSFAVGLFAMAVGLSGSVLTFREDIEHAFYEPAVTPSATSARLAVAVAQASKVEPARRVSMIVLPSEPSRPIEVVLQQRGARTLKEADQWSVYLNPADGSVLSWRRREGTWIAWLRDLHFALFSGAPGLRANGWIALVLTLISITGLVLWIQTAVRGRLMSVNLKGSWKRTLWDLHRAGGALVLVFLCLASLTGAYYAFRDSFTKLVALAGPLPPRSAPTVEAPSAPLPQSAPQPLSIDEVESRARPLVPGARLAVLRPPSQPTQAWVATFHRQHGEGESVDSGPTAYLNPYTGELLRLDDAATMSLPGKVLKAIEPLHFGKAFGLPGKIIWFVVGLTPGLLFLSGLVMWRNRTRPAKSRARAS